MSHLFSPLTIRSVECRNRVFVSPMCQYSSWEGFPTDWHLVHLGSRAVGGAAVVMMEATAVSAEGRISPDDMGIWSDEHARAIERVSRFIRTQGAVPGIQLSHAGRKASTAAPFRGGRPLPPSDGGWQVVGASEVPFGPGYASPRVLTEDDIGGIVSKFSSAARRALEAGFEIVEIHAAHGYLLHQFLSPLSNARTDDYGGTLENRLRFPLAVVDAVRAAWPERLPMFVRLSATDWVEGGWSLEDSVAFARRLRDAGVDMVDCSSGGMVPGAKIPAGPGYQVPFAAAIRREAGIATAAVGMITSPEQAEQIIATGQADAVMLARALLRDPYWPLSAARRLGVNAPWPPQYERAKPR
jgi:2,4-dienoyl-CoA reductase-like NADH-dependent reductase (Old Yellow Enzyme family)